MYWIFNRGSESDLHQSAPRLHIPDAKSGPHSQAVTEHILEINRKEGKWIAQSETVFL